MCLSSIFHALAPTAAFSFPSATCSRIMVIFEYESRLINTKITGAFVRL